MIACLDVIFFHGSICFVRLCIFISELSVILPNSLSFIKRLMTTGKHFSVQKWLQVSLGGNVLVQLHFPFYVPVLCLVAGLHMSRKSYGYNLVCSRTLRPQEEKKSKPLYS